MGGGLMQLVAYGAQDVYISGNPQITFFKVVYRRHTNFAVEPIPQTWNGAAEFGRTVTCNINRNGDLITNMYVAVELSSLSSRSNWGYVRRLGHAMIQSYKIEIGGSKIDEQYGDWLNIWYELTHAAGQERGYAKMIGDDARLYTIGAGPIDQYQMYIPLQFWFNRNNGLALPLIALQYHDVRITVVFRNAIDCINWKGISAPQSSEIANLMSECHLLIDYVYLGDEERKRFAQDAHEYLIEQLQFTGSESLTATSNKYRLNFNHPSKYLIWVPHLSRYNNRSKWIATSFDNNWSAALDRFAKIIAVAATYDVKLVKDSGVNSYDITLPFTTGDAAGNITTASPVPIGGITKALLDKIDVKFLILSTSGTIVGTDKTTIQNGTADSATTVLDNSIVTRNELTIADISLTIEQLKNGSTDAWTDVLDFFAINTVDYFNYGNNLDGSDNPVYNAKIQLNGHDRFQALDGVYFNYVQPAQHFPNTPADGINVYSFALKAQDHQPTGTCNFSRIDNATLQVDLGVNNQYVNTYTSKYLGADSNSLLNIYTVNYNVLRVMSGMAGTAYSN